MNIPEQQIIDSKDDSSQVVIKRIYPYYKQNELDPKCKLWFINLSGKIARITAGDGSVMEGQIYDCEGPWTNPVNYQTAKETILKVLIKVLGTRQISREHNANGLANNLLDLMNEVKHNDNIVLIINSYVNENSNNIFLADIPISLFD